MNLDQYLEHINLILNTAPQAQLPPYDKPDYMEYTKLNSSRMNRWLKSGSLSTDFKEVIKKIEQPQQWIVITEPWCGDAAHNLPFIIMAAKEHPLIQLSFELRDSAPHRIEQYLTNGSKSIPKLIIKDENGTDLAVWGPRPGGCQALIDLLKVNNTPFQEVITETQNWYNKNRGVELQEELKELVAAIVRRKQLQS